MDNVTSFTYMVCFNITILSGCTVEIPKKYAFDNDNNYKNILHYHNITST